MRIKLEEPHYLNLQLTKNYSNQKNIVLVKEQTYKSMDQNRWPINKFMEIQSIDF